MTISEITKANPNAKLTQQLLDLWENPIKGFYEHMGFMVKSRSECDDYGNPFPILHMTLRI